MRSKSGSRAAVGGGRDTLAAGGREVAAASDSGAVESWVELRGCSEGVTSEGTLR